MKLFHITRPEHGGYETYSDAVVCAENEDDAKLFHPSGSFWQDGQWLDHEERVVSYFDEESWITPDEVRVVHIGEASPTCPRGVVCASFHAG